MIKYVISSLTRSYLVMQHLKKIALPNILLRMTDGLVAQNCFQEQIFMTTFPLLNYCDG